jgi:hypothetical protein
MKRTITTLCGLLVLGLVGSASAAAPKTVFTDPAGDVGADQQPTGAVAEASASGFDLVSGTVVRKGKNLAFTVTHADVPASGHLPEGFRFLWHFASGKNEYRVTVKSQDIGKPDPVGGDLNEDGVGKIGPLFRLEQCGTLDVGAPVTFSTCKMVAFLSGSFDSAKKSFTFLAQMKTIKAKPGTKIVAGTSGAAGTGCVICWIPHYAERSLTPATIIDSAMMTGFYKVPR